MHASDSPSGCVVNVAVLSRRSKGMARPANVRSKATLTSEQSVWIEKPEKGARCPAMYTRLHMRQ